MNIINIEHISKVYGEKVIFDDASYGIQEGDKIGIIGINGTGKTTLLNMIAGREETDSGSIIRQNGLHMAYLSQNPAYEKEDTVLSFVTRGIDPSDWTAISEAKSNLMTLGLTNYEEKLEHLSGGQRKKVRSQGYCLVPLMCLFWTSRQTIWMGVCSSGWRITCADSAGRLSW